MSRVAIFFLSVLVLVRSAPAAESNRLSDFLLEHALLVSHASELLVDGRPALLVEIQGENAHEVDRTFLFQIASRALKPMGSSLIPFRGNYREALSAQRVSAPILLAPKWIIDVSLNRDAVFGYEVRMALSFLRYRAEATSRFMAERTILKQQELKGIELSDVEDAVAAFVQKELLAQPKGEKPKFLTKAALTSNDSTYQVIWKDPDPKGNRFYLGASVGTPALANLHFGYWGGAALPLVADLSGMYINDENRGAQLTMGWAFKNTGDFRAFGGAAILVADATQSSSNDILNPLGQVTATQLTTNDYLTPYAGPVFGVDWRNFRLQTGVGFHLGGDAAPPVKFLFQIGFTPPL